jgi:hypothetical protein
MANERTFGPTRPRKPWSRPVVIVPQEVSSSEFKVLHVPPNEAHTIGSATFDVPS